MFKSMVQIYTNKNKEKQMTTQYLSLQRCDRLTLAGFFFFFAKLKMRYFVQK